MTITKTLAELDSIHARMTGAVTPLDDQTFTRRPTEEVWSVAEVLHHLCIVEQKVLEILEAGVIKPPRSIPAWRRLMPLRFLIGNRVRRVKAPKMAEPLSPPPRETVMENFNRAREATKEFGARHSERLKRVVFKHPILGEMDGIGAISFVGYHELRHLKQIQETIRKLEG